MFGRKPQTFTRIWLRSFATLFAGVSVFLAVVTSAHDSAELAKPRHEAPARSTVLVEKHNCWTDKAPHNVIPGHAVVTLPGQNARYVKSDIGFGIWLDGNPGTLHAFCK